MNLEISNRQNIVELEDNMIAMFNELAIESLKYEGWDEDFEISLSLVDNDEIKELNKTFRGKDSSTDVLSFPLYEASMEEKLLGDIVISIEKAIEQAKEYNHTITRELGFLFVHSMLHLMGYDHNDEENTKNMRKKEEAILQNLGLIRK
ncbi:rRNA maturation RNase YbeY [Serpentinicella sp. ANB-PHB4]|uniref:rRNA maturation RNase YbeY n=1 Tax=Serpentinicella sp. ANB-PHB4 TaxID=3074076 RepID=UPI002861B7F2|nr:rRNA maturation RNase YbeY [Serpentinicella sp. ANB-PHB4]MDR5657985.1 rRNA maturation RNase YbeY [Serpentinicella sp. ANB-PHB4]